MEPRTPRLVAHFLNELHRTYRLLQGTNVSGELSTSIVRDVFVRVSPANRLQTEEGKKFGLSTVFVKEPLSRGCATFCKLDWGTDSARGHLSVS